MPADYKGNFIRVKVYTQWSLNDDPEFHYTRDIIINNTDEPDINKISVLKTNVELFPEGGDLINGLNSRVAFKSRDNRGLPVSANIPIAELNTGVLQFTLFSSDWLPLAYGKYDGYASPKPLTVP